MRPLSVPVVAAALLTGGCSLVWDMGSYEPTADRSRDGAATSSSGASGGAPSLPGDGGADVAAAATCNDEIEPNDSPRDAVEIPPGKTCAALGGPGDTDYWRVTSTSEVSLTVTIKVGMVFFVMPYGEGPTVHDEGGPTTLVLPAGTHDIWIQTQGLTFGEYSIER
jgi:hypothetical protein